MDNSDQNIIQNLKKFEEKLKDFRDNILYREIDNIKKDNEKVQTDLKKTLEKVEKAKTDIEKIKNDIINSDLWRKRFFWIGIGGVAILFLILIGEVILNTTQIGKQFPKLIRGLFRTYYPPEFIYSNHAPKIDIDDLEQVVDEVKNTKLKEWIKSWGNEEYEYVFANDEFFSVMGKQAKAYLFRKLNTASGKISAATVEEIGNAVLTSAEIEPLGIRGQTVTKNCKRPINDNDLAAIILISEDAPNHHYRWIGCTSNYPRQIFIGINSVDGKSLETNIEVKEVRRQGKFNPNHLRVQVTKAVETRIKLSGRIQGWIFIDRAED